MVIVGTRLSRPVSCSLFGRTYLPGLLYKDRPYRPGRVAKGPALPDGYSHVGVGPAALESTTAFPGRIVDLHAQEIFPGR